MFCFINWLDSTKINYSLFLLRVLYSHNIQLLNSNPKSKRSFSITQLSVSSLIYFSNKKVDIILRQQYDISLTNDHLLFITYFVRLFFRLFRFFEKIPFTKEILYMIFLSVCLELYREVRYTHLVLCQCSSLLFDVVILVSFTFLFSPL